MESPKINRILHESGAISDEVDWNLAKFLLAERGTGYVPCCASLVELDVADVLAGERAHRFHRPDRLSYPQARLAPGEVRPVVVGHSQTPTAAVVCSSHERSLAHTAPG